MLIWQGFQTVAILRHKCREMSETKIFAVKKISRDKAELLMYKYIGGSGLNSNDFVSQLKSLEKTYKFIDLRINSGGGDVFEGIAMYNAVKNSPSVIDTYCEGIAGSMASILFQAGRTRYISKYGQVMTHKPSGVGMGSSERLREVAGRIDTLENTMANIYAERTGKSEDECKSRYMNGRDNWFVADAAISEGLADAIYDQGKSITVPVNVTSELEVYESYAAQLYIKNENDKMSEVTLTAEQLATMGLTGSVTIDQVMANYKAMAEAAAKVPTLEASVAGLTSEKEKAEQDLKDFKAADELQRITDLLAAKVKDTSITQEQSNLFARQFAGRYDDLKAVMDTMKPYQSITGAIAGDQHDQNEVAGLMKMTGKELFMTGKFDRLKELSADGFAKKYKEYTGGEA